MDSEIVNGVDDFDRDHFGVGKRESFRARIGDVGFYEDSYATVRSIHSMAVKIWQVKNIGRFEPSLGNKDYVVGVFIEEGRKFG